ncbi:MAG: argininosuccinate lyase [Pseudomonadota bacterium]
MKSWQHLGAYSRFKEEPAEIFTRTYYGPIIDRTKPLYYACSFVNMAHLVMLVESKIIDKNSGAKILQAMLEADSLGSEAFPFDREKGNIYLNLEHFLLERLGETVGGCAYIGRSRLDYEATIRRVYVRDQLLKGMRAIQGLIDTLLFRASEHSRTIMPAYSHLQQSQPCTFGHYLLAFADAFFNDMDRLKRAFLRTNLSPLGAAAAAGESLPLNRKRTAELLGFGGFIENAREACFSRDYALESCSGCAIFMSNLGQLATDLDIFCTREFNMIELADAFSGTSSFMPQKKNPLPLEAVRAYSGYFIGLLPALLGVLKTNSEEVDIIEFTPDFNFDAFRMLADMAELMEAVVASMTIRKERMEENAKTNWSAASALAERITHKTSISWRTAHRIVGRMVRNALDQGLTPEQATKQMLEGAAKEILGGNLKLDISTVEIRMVLDPKHFIQTRSTPGSTHPEEVKRMTEDRKVRLKRESTWIKNMETKTNESYEKLRRVAKEIAKAAA